MSLFVSLQNCHSLFELSLFSSRAHSAFLSSWQCPAAICDFSQDTQFSQFTVPHLAKWFVGSSAILTEWDPGEGLNPESLGLGSYNLIPKEILHNIFVWIIGPFSISFCISDSRCAWWVSDRQTFFFLCRCGNGNGFRIILDFHIIIIIIKELSFPNRRPWHASAFVMPNSNSISAAVAYWNQLEVSMYAYNSYCAAFFATVFSSPNSVGRHHRASRNALVTFCPSF